jgi:hypothetical protein
MRKIEMLKFVVVVLSGTLFLATTASAQCVEGDDCGNEMPAEQVGPEAPVVETDAGDAVASEGEAVKKERIKPLWISGLALFGSVYLANIIGNAALSEEDAKGTMVGYALIPLAGPFVAMGNSSDDVEVESAFKGVLVMAGVLQIVGAGLFTAGMIIKRKPKAKQAAKAPRFMFTPTPIGRHGAGAVFTMTHF